MAWNTRELAEAAGTTVNTIRHYHRRGLLDEPERSSNGYRQYDVSHLIRLLQIRRLRDIGVPIADIERMDSQVGTSTEVLAALDAEHAEAISRSERARRDIAEMLENGAIVEVPSGFAGVAAQMSENDRALVLIYSRMYRSEAMADVREMLEQEPDAATAEFESLPAEAVESVRSRLAREFAVTIARSFADYPWIWNPKAQLRSSPSFSIATMSAAMHEIYNEAQIDVLTRAGILARALADGDGGGSA